MDVADIDRVVGSAGPFEGDDLSDIKDVNKDALHNWNLETSKMWFVKKVSANVKRRPRWWCQLKGPLLQDHFSVDRNWQTGDQSDEDEDPTDDKRAQSMFHD